MEKLKDILYIYDLSYDDLSKSQLYKLKWLYFFHERFYNLTGSYLILDLIEDLLLRLKAYGVKEII